MPESFVSIPAQHADAFAIEGEGGLTLRLYRLRGFRAHGRPVLLFGHACGFAAGSSLPFLTALTEEADVFAFDARGHGGSDAPANDLSLYSPDHYARDLARVRAALAGHVGVRPVAYVGHSLGAASMLRLGCKHPDLFAAHPWRALVLFEPPMYPSPDRPELAEAVRKDRELIEGTASRRARWPSPEAFVTAVSGRGAFLRRIAHEFLVAHAHAALRPARDGGGYELCCPPAVEVATYRGFSEDSTFRALPEFPRSVPMHLVGGDASDAAARSWVTLMMPVAAARLGLTATGAGPRRFTALPNRGHLMIQEDAEMTRRMVGDFLASL